MPAGKITFNCEQCNKDFLEYKSNRVKKHIYCSKACAYEAKKTILPWNKGLKGFMLGQANGEWKGDNVGYSALHTWVKRHLGKAVWCERCASCIQIEWANISHEYKRDLMDWMQLCHKCHFKYDSGENWGSGTKIFLIKNRHHSDRRVTI